MTQPLAATKHNLKFGATPKTWTDAFVVPELSQVRYAPTSMSIFVGKAENYITRLTKNSQKMAKRLQANGFKAYQIELKVPGVKSIVKSLSTSDFEIFVVTEAEGKDANPVALAHLAASFSVRKAELEAQLLSEVLGATTDLDKEALYSTSFDAYLEALQANYDDWAIIEEQETFNLESTASWLDSMLLTGTGYDDDSDCYQAPLDF